MFITNWSAVSKVAFEIETSIKHEQNNNCKKCKQQIQPKSRVGRSSRLRIKQDFLLHSIGKIK